MISKKRLAVMTAMLSGLGPFAVDTYLPSFQMMAHDLKATELEVQQTLTVYLVAFGLSNLFHGAVSDSLGRKQVILALLGLFGLASLGASFSDTIHELWFWRALQGMTGGVGVTVGRALIRDSLDGAEAQRLMSYSTMMFALAPALAPLVGGWIAAGMGWRAVFWFLVFYAWALGIFCFFALPETLAKERRQPLHLKPLLSAYGRFFSSQAFWRVAGAQALNFQGFFIYILAAPALMLTLLKLGPTDFYWLFVPSTLGTLIGAAASARAAGRRSSGDMIRIGFTMMLAAALSGVAVAVFFEQGGQAWLAGLTGWTIRTMPWLVLHVFFYVTGMAFAMSALQVRVLDLAPERRGTVASCQAFVQSLGNSLAAGVLVPLLWSSTVSLAAGMLVLLLSSILLYRSAAGSGEAGTGKSGSATTGTGPT